MDSSTVRRRRPMPVASSPAPSSAMPGSSKPVRGSCAVAAGAVVVVAGVVVVVEGVVVDGEVDTGGLLLSGGPPAWLLGALLVAEVFADALFFGVVFAVEPLNGSVYWSSPAPLCARAGAAPTTSAAVASTG